MTPRGLSRSVIGHGTNAMRLADEPIEIAQATPGESPRYGPISVALLAAIALVPIVVAVGFLSDRTGARGSVPDDITVMSLRGALDGGADPHSSTHPRAAGL